MLTQVHPAARMLQGDAGYNPRDVVAMQLPNGEQLLTGEYVDDGYGASRAPRPTRPFWITLARDFEAWHELNSRIFDILQEETRDVVIACRPQPEHVLVCPTCRAIVPIGLHSVFGHGHITGVERPTCAECGRAFTAPEIDERGTRL